jgi:hypothetical protein
LEKGVRGDLKMMIFFPNKISPNPSLPKRGNKRGALPKRGNKRGALPKRGNSHTNDRELY